MVRQVEGRQGRGTLDRARPLQVDRTSDQLRLQASRSCGSRPRPWQSRPTRSHLGPVYGDYLLPLLPRLRGVLERLRHALANACLCLPAFSERTRPPRAEFASEAAEAPDARASSWANARRALRARAAADPRACARGRPVDRPGHGPLQSQISPTRRSTTASSRISADGKEEWRHRDPDHLRRCQRYDGAWISTPCSKPSSAGGRASAAHGAGVARRCRPSAGLVLLLAAAAAVVCVTRRSRPSTGTSSVRG